MVAITALAALVVAGWYISYQHGLYQGKHAEVNESQDLVKNQQKS